MGQNSIISSFFARRAKKASAKDRSSPQELEVGPRSGPYLLVSIKWSYKGFNAHSNSGVLLQHVQRFGRFVQSMCTDFLPTRDTVFTVLSTVQYTNIFTKGRTIYSTAHNTQYTTFNTKDRTLNNKYTILFTMRYQILYHGSKKSRQAEPKVRCKETLQ